MNERIEQLAEQATEEMDPEAFSEDMNIPTEWVKKFSELIVRECIRIDIENPDAAPGVEIAKHFGVEL